MAILDNREFELEDFKTLPEPELICAEIANSATELLASLYDNT